MPHKLSKTRRCQLLGISRSSAYHKALPPSEEDLKLMRLLDELHLQYPYKGSRRLIDNLWDEHGLHVNRKRVQRLMRLLGIQALHPKTRTTKRNKAHKTYPYLLKGLSIERPNQVWCTDITYIPMRKGFMYLVAVMDWYSRKVLSWRLSNSLDADFCVEALQEAIDHYGAPEIFNSDQGCQFTSEIFTSTLLNHNVKISMDGKGRWMDNIFIERLWRSLKYEEVYLHAYKNVKEAKTKIDDWLKKYNEKRRHQALDRMTPDQVYYGLPSNLPLVA